MDQVTRLEGISGRGGKLERPLFSVPSRQADFGELFDGGGDGVRAWGFEGSFQLGNRWLVGSARHRIGVGPLGPVLSPGSETPQLLLGLPFPLWIWVAAPGIALPGSGTRESPGSSQSPSSSILSAAQGGGFLLHSWQTLVFIF